MFSPLRSRSRQAARQASRHARRRALRLEALEDRRLMTVSGWGASNGANPGYADPPAVDEYGESGYVDYFPDMSPMDPSDNYDDPENQDWWGWKQEAETDVDFMDFIEKGMTDKTIAEKVNKTGALPGMPVLDSNLKATHTIYLNFTGSRGDSSISGGDLGDYDLANHHVVFDLDGDPRRFNDLEADAIYRIWKYVADDYAPFDVNVTTYNNSLRPSLGTYDQVLEVAIGGFAPRVGDSTLYGINVGDYGTKDERTVFVFSDRHKDLAWQQDNPADVYEFFVKSVADTASHEAGHAFGLEHQAWWGTSGEMYDDYRPEMNDGHGLHRSIMGMPFGSDGEHDVRSLWDAGGDDLGVWQNDLEKLGAKLGFRSDDRPDEFFFNLPEVEPGRFFTTGFIGVPDALNPAAIDHDWFAFTNPGGPVNIQARSPAGEFGNLHSRIDVWNVTTNQWVQTSAIEDAVNGLNFLHLPAGKYMIGVSSTGGFGNAGNYELEVVAFGSSPIHVPGPTGVVMDASGTFLDGLDWQFQAKYALAAAPYSVPIIETVMREADEPALATGDFTGDGNVDGFDFLAWQLGFGAEAATSADGDATADGMVDELDLASWSSDFGSFAPAAPESDAPRGEGDDWPGEYAPVEETPEAESTDEHYEWAPTEELGDEAPTTEDDQPPAAWDESWAGSVEEPAAESAQDDESVGDFEDGEFMAAVDEAFAEF